MRFAAPLDARGRAAILIRLARAQAGLSQAELARRAGTSQPHVAAYEAGYREPTFPTLLRLLGAAGAGLDVKLCRRAEAMTREELRSLRLHEVIAARVITDPDRIIAHARANLRRMRHANPDRSAEPYFDRWERLLRGPVHRIVAALVSDDQSSRDLRQVTPFAGVLSDDERREILRHAKEEAA